jgi:hypothetical protein
MLKLVFECGARSRHREQSAVKWEEASAMRPM